MTKKTFSTRLDPAVLAVAQRVAAAERRSVTAVIELAVLACAEALDARPRWRPIETAPRDNTRVLLTDGETITIGFRDVAASRWVDATRCEGDEAPMWYEPTHWRPLPEPPGDG